MAPILEHSVADIVTLRVNKTRPDSSSLRMHKIFNTLKLHALERSPSTGICINFLSVHYPTVLTGLQAVTVVIIGRQQQLTSILVLCISFSVVVRVEVSTFATQRGTRCPSPACVHTYMAESGTTMILLPLQPTKHCASFGQYMTLITEQREQTRRHYDPTLLSSIPTK